MAPIKSASPLFQPFKVGEAELKHRVVYAPLTRCRAIDTVPVPEMALYYAQRASEGGLMIAEATCIMPQAHGYPHTPGVYTRQQVDAWRPIVEAVHEKGATFFLQLWHVGRASHNNYQPDGSPPVAPSALAIGSDWEVYTQQGGPYKYPTPRALTKREIAATVQAYADAARNSIAAGFDGVEIHAANGYLLAQFVAATTNDRTDEYGGSLENRTRLLFEVVEAVVEAVGGHRVGIRLSPFNKFLDCIEPDPFGTYGAVVEGLNKYGLAYVHMVEPRVLGNADVTPEKGHTLKPFREAFDGPFISAGGHTRDTAIDTVASHEADLTAFGRWFISNPDLPLRLKLGAPLAQYNRDAFYSQDMVVGYTDYPSLTEEEVEDLQTATAKA
ncbi:12-oxophytodienoic acid reductase [Raphidocelis subcapitata]|uniref:12-oxophytodienoic acid reductase n=1 Tax=Raphidocelis subcapitata TaxID=307507 RepID=A0A2V0P6N7_9CHLO|nr:12-oxophytodienoic acid reductase [Raphidocelis subcapitata]|eukprot:GBF95506.1 12-oxophytodienoic acid reductase [Raphidocelis subcapitata]